MPLQDTDKFLVGRNGENRSATALHLKEYIASGYSGTVTLPDGTQLVYTDGILTAVN